MTIETILVSGGSRGLGLDICDFLLNQGFNVASFARSSTKEIEILQERYREKFFFQEIDITQVDAVQAYVSVVGNRFSGIDCLVNNAAIGQDDLLVHMDKEAIRDLVDVNILGTVMLTRMVLRDMLTSNGGHIVFISSICSTKGFPGLSVYSGTKGFLDSFSRSLISEYKHRDIYINTISPGFFASEMSSVLSEQQLNRIKRNTPSGKLTESQDVINILEMILKSDNLNGANITIDGGVVI